jgi:PAS domain S-box-containing protein
MVESQGELVCRYQSDTTLTFVNEAYCRYFGRSREQLIGRKFIELIPESAWEGVRKHVQSLIANPRSDMHEHQVIRASGQIAWQQWTNFAILETDGTVRELQAIGRDITDRREAETALKEREERIQLAAESAHLALWVLDYEHGNSWMNEKGRTLYCLEANEPITREKLLALVHTADVFMVEAAIQRALDGQDTFEIEHRMVRANDETRWLIVRGRCLRNSGGDVLELLGVTIDVTAQKQAALQLQAQREEMAYLSRLSMLGEMAGALAHELNQPLTAIVANAHAGRIFLTRGQTDPAFLKELIEDMAEDGCRAGDIIRAIRGLVRKAESVRKEVNLNSVIAEVLRLMHSDLLIRECSVETDCDPNLPSIQADPVQMQQVLLNLIVNAIEAMQSVPASQRRVLIHTLRPSDGMVSVRVRDFGVGIPSVNSEHMFRQFFSTKRDGMGLGLGIARSIIEAHAGTLSAENAEDGGAQFSFHLPIRAESLH